MQQKINILIGTAIITLLGLVSIQAYLIYNTYELKKEAFLTETRKAISEIDEESEVIANIEDESGQHFMELLWDYKYKGLEKEQLLLRFKKKRDSLNKTFNALYYTELEKAKLGYDIKFRKNISTVILLDSVKNDTVFVFEKGKHLLLLGEDFKESEGYGISRAFSQSDYTNEADSLRRRIEFRVITYDRMNISKWKTIVLGRMSLLFIGSLVLLLFVVGLFYYSISNLIKQKKVADVKTDFINNITHELKTPLATLAIVSKSLKKNEIVSSPKALENTLGILDRQNIRLHKLIDQVTNNSLGSEDLVIQKEHVPHAVYMNNVVADFSLTVQSRGVEIATQIAEEKVDLGIDTFLFTTALLNVLENAVKYGKEKIALSIRTHVREGLYQIEIEDNGLGISVEHQKSIFEKFYRITSGNVHNVKGLGLGLYYTKEVIDAHGGSITLKSRPNRGSTFTITIPLN